MLVAPSLRSTFHSAICTVISGQHRQQYSVGAFDSVLVVSARCSYLSASKRWLGRVFVGYQTASGHVMLDFGTQPEDKRHVCGFFIAVVWGENAIT